MLRLLGAEKLRKPQHQRATLPNELETYKIKQFVKFNEITQNNQTENVLSYEVNDLAIIQSDKLMFGIQHFLVKIKNDLSYKAFCFGSSCTIKPLSENRLYCCPEWSITKEVIRFLKNKKNSAQGESSSTAIAMYGKI